MHRFHTSILCNSYLTAEIDRPTSATGPFDRLEVDEPGLFRWKRCNPKEKEWPLRWQFMSTIIWRGPLLQPTFWKRCVISIAERPVGNFAAAMLIEVETDRTVLKRLADRVGSGSSPIKEAAAWLSEKVSRLKLGGDNDGLATFEALEFLALGVLGKLSLWKALREIAREGRLRDLDFATLIARALDQHSQLEAHRLELAKKAFTNNSDS